MQFTEIGFALLLGVVWVLYWLPLRGRLMGQNVLLLAASYLFYGWWDWRFLGLILLTTLSTYLLALRPSRPSTAANVVLNLGILLAFKYFNFFGENLQRLFALVGWELDWVTLDVLLPVGISFYTFQAIGYSVDVHRRRIEPCRNPLTFAVFIAYFPQLVAGPIEKASQLLPQLASNRQWHRAQAVSGLRMVLFGVVKKVCVANLLGYRVDMIFSQWDLDNPLICLRAGVMFALQIYFDFSAYSEIARGTSRLLGIELMTNFRFPYFSRNVVEFWQRWHISLMLWFRDYLYIPLGGNRRGFGRTVANTVVVFLLSGLWHGAEWNFVLWGAYWALIYPVAKMWLHRCPPSEPITVRHLPQIILTFGVVAFGFFIFRCTQPREVLSGLYALPVYVAAFVAAAVAARGVRFLRPGRGWWGLLALLPLALLQWHRVLENWWLISLALVVTVEWRNRNLDYPMERMPQRRMVRYAFYWACMLLLLVSEDMDISFIYFQF